MGLYDMNNYDYLTGLSNMTFFFEIADVAVDIITEKGGDPAMLFIDLSGMKHYNGKHGYKKGDELLVSFAGLLAERFGKERCCRMGEDHFAVLSERQGLEDRLRALFDDWDDMHKDDAPAIRAGVYFRSIEPVDTSAACDRAKYACDSLRKNNHGSCFVYFDEKMLYESRMSRYIIENLDRAIEEKWIVPHYQAIVRATNGKVCDEEALARWIDPEKGMLSPDLFIPVLEDAGLIYKLDLYMIEQVLEKINTSRRQGFGTNPVSVNLSRRDFDACDIIDEIKKRVDKAGLEPSDLSIEITESTVARNFDYIKSQVERFRELGFPVWMDDFGSGYSSLDLLQNISFDLIKFDMHFMRQFDNGDETKIILTELMRMANALGTDTLCEGVEMEEQVYFLREIGCSKIQGYYYEKPLSMEDLMKKFERGDQIGCENPEEKEYYSKLGSVNMYDLSTIAGMDSSDLKYYFKTLPMAIIEVRGEESRFARSNQAYREFVDGVFGYNMPRGITEFSEKPQGIGKGFLEKVKACSKTRSSVIVDEKIPDGSTVHTFLRTIATNTHDGTTAVAVAVLAVTDDPDVTYANIARALASDYFNLFYVDLRTDDFIEYSSDADRDSIAYEKHDSDFFANARRDAYSFLHEDDRERFVDAFTKEKIISSLEKQKSYNLDYRLLRDGRPVYVSMKITRMPDDDNHIIIGVSNVNLQMNQRKAIEKLRQEQRMYNRIRALTDDFEVMYLVDPGTGKYIETGASSEFEELGVSKEGDDFFKDSEINGHLLVHPDDALRFTTSLQKDNLLRKIEENGELTMDYRLMMGGDAKPKRLKARRFSEDGADKIIIGVTAVG